MKKNIQVAPSLLSADFSRLGDEVEKVTRQGADMIHLDVMDGHFVPNITFGPPVIRAVRKYSPLPFDAHLMILNPEKYIHSFRDAGVDMLTVQVEICHHLQRVLTQIREAGMKSGVAVNPHTPVDFLPHILDVTDLVLVMTVNPGFGGQKFISSMLPKIRQVRNIIDQADHFIHLEVDGGIDPDTAPLVIDAGADLLVSGSFIFGSPDYESNIGKLKNNGGD